MSSSPESAFWPPLTPLTPRAGYIPAPTRGRSPSRDATHAAPAPPLLPSRRVARCASEPTPKHCDDSAVTPRRDRAAPAPLPAPLPVPRRAKATASGLAGAGPASPVHAGYAGYAGYARVPRSPFKAEPEKREKPKPKPSKASEKQKELWPSPAKAKAALAKTKPAPRGKFVQLQRSSSTPQLATGTAEKAVG